MLRLFVAAVALSLVSAPALAYQYSVINLGALPGGNNMFGTAMNSSGDVVGWSDFNGGQAFIWSGGTLANLDGISPSGNYAYDINDSGQVVGVSANAKAVMWESGTGTVIDIGHLPTRAGTGNGHQAYGISNTGHVVGQSWTGPQYGSHPFLWTGQMQDLCPQGPQSMALTINDLDVVAGANCGEPGSGFVWDGGLTQIPIIPTEINNAGWIAGQVASDSAQRAGYWANGIVTIVTPTSGGIANGLNDLGEIVGSYDGGSDYRAFLWDSALGLRDLNDLIDPSLGIYLRSAKDINDTGQILVNGQISIDGYTRDRAFLLIPQAVVPVGPAGLFLASALSLLGFARRRPCRTRQAHTSHVACTFAGRFHQATFAPISCADDTASYTLGTAYLWASTGRETPDLSIHQGGRGSRVHGTARSRQVRRDG